MSSLGTPGSATYAVTLSGVEDMMSVLPDNTSNQILASDVRNIVLSLYDDITGLSNSSSVTSSNVYYTNNNPSSVTVGGWQSGSTFNNLSTQQIFDGLFYPYVQPVLSLSSSPSILEYGNTSSIQLNWSVQAKKNNIVSSVIYKPFVVNQTIPNPRTLSTPSSNTTSSGNISAYPILNTTTSFTMSVNDHDSVSNTGGVNNTSCQLLWSQRRFWGTLSTGNALLSVSSATFSYNNISSLNTDSSPISTYVQTRSITTNNNYVVFIWPNSSVNLASSPYHVSIGGFSNNNWIKTRNNIPFTNQFGYTSNYDVWVFGQIQSPSTFTYVIT
jgi:hypothetical protein